MSAIISYSSKLKQYEIDCDLSYGSLLQRSHLSVAEALNITQDLLPTAGAETLIKIKTLLGNIVDSLRHMQDEERSGVLNNSYRLASESVLWARALVGKPIERKTPLIEWAESQLHELNSSQGTLAPARMNRPISAPMPSSLEQPTAPPESVYPTDRNTVMPQGATAPPVSEYDFDSDDEEKIMPLGLQFTEQTPATTPAPAVRPSSLPSYNFAGDLEAEVPARSAQTPRSLPSSAFHSISDPSDTGTPAQQSPREDAVFQEVLQRFINDAAHS